jgi:hypothetical protein
MLMVRLPRHDFGSLMTVPNSRVRSIAREMVIVSAAKFTALQGSARISLNLAPVITAVATIG